MKILFLGTGAADSPSDKTGVTDFRRHSSALIDGVILIDPNSWFFDACDEFSVDASKVKYILNTHLHDDHYSQEVVDRLTSLGAEFIDASNGEEICIDGYRVLFLNGNHTIPVHHFLIENGGKRLFYGLDGAWLLYEEMQAIEKNGVDLAVFDATIGFQKGDWRIFEHNDLNMVIDMHRLLKRSIKRTVISHIAMTLHTEHKVLSDEMSKYGIITAFDGLEIEF